MALEKHAFTLAALLAMTLAASAADPKPSLMKQFNAWGAYSYSSDNGKICYVLSVPTAEKPKNVNHGDVYFLISQRPSQNISYQPEAQVGYDLKEGEKVDVDVDGKGFAMFSKGNRAWVENAAQEPALVSDMRSGHMMTIKAVSSRGTRTEYTFSLSGITAALDKIKSCK